MLTDSEKIKTKHNVILNSALDIAEELTTEMNGKGRKFVSRFIEAGIVHYADFGDVLITKETLDKFINTMVGCPVIIQHKDITDSNADSERVGVVSNVWYNSEDGWYYCEGIIWNKQAIDLVKNQGWSVSCTYDFESDNQAKTHNGKQIDREFTNGKFLHLALVDNPRYERANIVMNAKEQEHQPSKKQDDEKTADEFEKKLKEAEERQGKQKAKNIEDKRKETIIMTVLNDLENFVRGIAENACKKEEAKNEDEDKRKLIDEVAGMMKSAGADDELIRTAIAKMEKLAYDKSEAGTADNKYKNEKEKVKEEIKEEKKADKEEPLEDKEEEKEIVKNSSDKEQEYNSIDKVKEMVYTNSNKVKSLYTSQRERLELGDKY